MDTEEAFERLQKHIAERDAEVASLKKTNTDLQKQLRDLVAKESSASTGQLEELKKAHTEIEKVLELTNKQRSSLEQEVAELKKTIAHEREEAQSKGKVAAAETTKLRDEIARLQKSEGDLKSEVEGLKRKQKSLEEQLEESKHRAVDHSAQVVAAPASHSTVDHSFSDFSSSYYLFMPQCLINEDPATQARNNTLRKLISALNEAVAILVVYFGGNEISNEEKLALGNDGQHPEISMIVRGKFCSTLTMVLNYGIRANNTGSVTLWNFIEATPTAAVSAIKAKPYKDDNMRFRSWVVSGLNERRFSEWISNAGMNPQVDNYFNEESVFKNVYALQAIAHALKPLSKLPFRMDVDFELHPPTGPIKASSQLLSCTWMNTGDEGGHQAWYYCFNCATPENTPMKCCVNCIAMCHNGHQITYAEESLICCDCGVTEDCTIIDDEEFEEEEQ
eukprot:TRINITY_DN7555_c0_g1_i1.p2 TRINITY_DN7555_c0_g1~~TRINITY_DN7555_c0_g1_i1.p2  ORF type:complete len:449 (+),score=133.48 TRINITY_DN7555_c0_g1_i1:2643-3989(+)